jgi:hypothetical protein
MFQQGKFGKIIETSWALDTSPQNENNYTTLQNSVRELKR